MKLLIFLLSVMVASRPLFSSGLKAWEKESPSGYQDLLEIEKQIADTLIQSKKAVVSIETSDGAGSGVIVSANGLVLTAAHVIGESCKWLWFLL